MGKIIGAARFDLADGGQYLGRFNRLNRAASDGGEYIGLQASHDTGGMDWLPGVDLLLMPFPGDILEIVFVIDFAL
ncbi:MAG: hypothetical protein K0R63_377 [Rickettsiales bacterium]|jgi:hypothetical protein|nr:hypothetical protein [Rickettsiales bacterium]